MGEEPKERKIEQENKETEKTNEKEKEKYTNVK